MMESNLIYFTSIYTTSNVNIKNNVITTTKNVKTKTKTKLNINTSVDRDQKQSSNKHTFKTINNSNKKSNYLSNNDQIDNS